MVESKKINVKKIASAAPRNDGYYALAPDVSRLKSNHGKFLQVMLYLMEIRRQKMMETALRQQVITYVDQLDSDKMHIALLYLKDLAEIKPAQHNSKTESELQAAEKALSELDKIRLRLKLNNSFDNDKKIIANAIWKK